MGRVSSRWYGLPLLRILLPLLTRFACCFCRHLRSWMLQGLKLLLGWSISSFSARAQTRRAQCHRAALGMTMPPTMPQPPRSNSHPRYNVQPALPDSTQPSPVPTVSPPAPRPLLPLPPCWAELSLQH